MTTYNVSVPVYFSLTIEAEDGMTKGEALKSLTSEDYNSFDDIYVSEMIEEIVCDDSRAKDIEVEVVD